MCVSACKNRAHINRDTYIHTQRVKGEAQIKKSCTFPILAFMGMERTALFRGAVGDANELIQAL